MMDAKENEYAIPFNSSIKFNCMIRDNALGNNNPATAAENMSVYLKGAPEKVLKRCNHVMLRGADGKIVHKAFDKAI